jgi:hypothetical protein
MREGLSGLAPEGEEERVDEVAAELVAGVDREEPHALFGEEGARELHRGDKAEPDVEADKPAESESLGAHLVQEHV